VAHPKDLVYAISAGLLIRLWWFLNSMDCAENTDEGYTDYNEETTICPGYDKNALCGSEAHLPRISISRCEAFEDITNLETKKRHNLFFHRDLKFRMKDENRAVERTKHIQQKNENTKSNEGYKIADIKRKTVVEFWNGCCRCPSGDRSGLNRQVRFSQDREITRHNELDGELKSILEEEKEGEWRWNGEKEEVVIVKRIYL
jgi:hypothetical protein